MEDAAIVDLYWQRSDQAIRETDQKYGRYCHAIAYHCIQSHEDAEECVNDTWLRAWNLMPDQRPSALAAFLGTITRNLAISRYRAKVSRKRGGGQIPLALDELSECIPSDADPEKSLELRELEEAVGRFMETLSQPERMVFTARYWYLAPVEEISHRMGFSAAKTTSMLHRIRGRLRTFLREEGLC